MISKLRGRASYANVTATLALVVAMGGSAYAAATITSADVKDDSLLGADIRGHAATDTAPEEDGSLTTYDIKNGTLGAVDLANDSVGSAEIVNNTITQSDLAAGSVGSGKVIDDSLKGSDIDESSLAGFVRGGGHIRSTAFEMTSTGGTISANLPGEEEFFGVVLHCSKDFGPGALMVVGASTEALSLWRDDALNPPIEFVTSPKGDSPPHSNTWWETAPNRIIWQISTASGKRATMIAVQRTSSTATSMTCNYEATVISND